MRLRWSFQARALDGLSYWNEQGGFNFNTPEIIDLGVAQSTRSMNSTTL